MDDPELCDGSCALCDDKHPDHEKAREAMGAFFGVPDAPGPSAGSDSGERLE